METPKNTTCPHCKLPLREYHDFETCSTCGTSYHQRCWEECDGCFSCTVPADNKNALDKSIPWYLYHNNRNLGPLTWEELCSQPGIEPDDLVWNKRLPDWIRVDQVPQLPLKSTEEKKKAEASDLSTAAEADESELPPAAAPDEKEELDRERPEEQLFPEEEAPQWKLGGRVKDPATAAEPPDSAGEAPAWESEPAELGADEPSRAEQIIEQLYPDEVPETPSDLDFLDRKSDIGEKRAPAKNPYRRHIFFGILLALGGAVIAVTTPGLITGREVFYYVAAGWAILIGVIDFFWGIWGSIKYKSREHR